MLITKWDGRMLRYKIEITDNCVIYAAFDHSQIPLPAQNVLFLDVLCIAVH